MKLSWSEAESKAQDRAEYRRRPVLRQELKGKEEEEEEKEYVTVHVINSYLQLDINVSR